MNYRPSFSQGAGAEPLGLALAERGWLAPARSDPDLHALRFRAEHPPGATSDPITPRREGRRGRVPDRDIINVGPRPDRLSASAPADVRDLAVSPTPDAALVTKTAVGRGRLTRLLLTLLAVEIVVCGGIYFGKRLAAPHVIFVPAASSDRSVIT